MPVNTVSEVPPNHHRVIALRQKHDELSQKVVEAQKDILSSDQYVNQLKKEKLLVKEKLFIEQQQRERA